MELSGLQAAWSQVHGAVEFGVDEANITNKQYSATEWQSQKWCAECTFIYIGWVSMNFNKQMFSVVFASMTLAGVMI